MQLIDIDKTRYRRHLKYVIVACILGLAVGSLAISQTLIALFPNESGRHFFWNLTGVIVSAIVVAFLLNKYRTHDFMTEVAYVWDLKQALNQINRKIPKLKVAANAGSADAMLALHYSYLASKQLWTLDDNTLVMEELGVAQIEVDVLAKKYGILLDAKDYHSELLKPF